VTRPADFDARLDRLAGGATRQANQSAHAALTDGWLEDDALPPDQWVWLHVPPSSSMPVTILCERPTSYRAHYCDSNMHPCRGFQSCELCARGIGAQRRTVLCVYDLRLRALGLLELGDLPSQALRAYSEAKGMLRGLTIALSREGQRPRGRILVLAPDTNHPTPPDPLPQSIDVAAALKATWARTARQRPPQ